MTSRSTSGRSIPAKLKIGLVTTADYAAKLAPFDQQSLAAWAADCAAHVISNFNRERSSDQRPSLAIEAARAWARGDSPMIRARAAAVSAHAAAREAIEPGAVAAARAAGHAAATAHSIRHARAAAMYAVLSAAGAESENERERTANAERHWQLRLLGRSAKTTLDPVR